MILKQALRFGLVGVVNTLIYFGLYLVILRWTPYLVAHFVAMVVAMVASFFLNVYFTYRTRPTWRKFLLFPLGNLASYVILTGGIALLVEAFHVDTRIAPLIAASIAIPVTFVLTRTVLLHDRTKSSERVPRPRTALYD